MSLYYARRHKIIQPLTRWIPDVGSVAQARAAEYGGEVCVAALDMGIREEIHVESGHYFLSAVTAKLVEHRFQMVQGVNTGDGYDCAAGKGMDYVGFERAFGQYDLRGRSAGTVYPRLRGTAVLTPGAGYPAVLSARDIITANLKPLYAPAQIPHGDEYAARFMHEFPLPVLSVKAGHTRQVMAICEKALCYCGGSDGERRPVSQSGQGIGLEFCESDSPGLIIPA